MSFDRNRSRATTNFIIYMINLILISPWGWNKLLNIFFNISEVFQSILSQFKLPLTNLSFIKWLCHIILRWWHRFIFIYLGIPTQLLILFVFCPYLCHLWIYINQLIIFIILKAWSFNCFPLCLLNKSTNFFLLISTFISRFDTLTYELLSFISWWSRNISLFCKDHSTFTWSYFWGFQKASPSFTLRCVKHFWLTPIFNNIVLSRWIIFI